MGRFAAQITRTPRQQEPTHSGRLGKSTLDCDLELLQLGQPAAREPPRCATGNQPEPGWSPALRRVALGLPPRKRLCGARLPPGSPPGLADITRAHW